MVRLLPLILLFVLLPGLSPVRAQSVPFIRGDADVSGAVDLTDGIRILRVLFVVPDLLPCPDATDLDDDGKLNIVDAIFLFRHLFQGGAEPPPPFTDCGEDPTEDALACPSFPPCEVVDPPCLDDEFLEGISEPIPGLDICLPAGLLEFPLDELEISVCPAGEAPGCPGEVEGCPITFSSLRARYDGEQKALALRLEGRIENLPIQVTTGGPLGGTSTCETSIHGEDGDDVPFSFEVVTRLVTEEREDGSLEVVGVEAGTIENRDIDLDASGGIVCFLFEAGQDVLIELLLAPLEEVAGSISEPLAESLVGLTLCE